MIIPCILLLIILNHYFEEGRVKVGPGLTEKNFVKTQKSLEMGCNKTCGWVVVVMLGGWWIGGECEIEPVLIACLYSSVSS